MPTRRQFLHSSAALATLTAAGCGGIDPETDEPADGNPNSTAPTGDTSITPTGDTSIVPDPTTEPTTVGGFPIEWQEIASVLEPDVNAVVYTAESPGPWPDKVEVHVPVVQVSGNQAQITVPHVMEADHYNDIIYVRNQNNVVIALKQFDYTDGELTHSFTIPPGTTTLKAYSNCNLHGLWRAPDYTP